MPPLPKYKLYDSSIIIICCFYGWIMAQQHPGQRHVKNPSHLLQEQHPHPERDIKWPRTMQLRHSWFMVVLWVFADILHLFMLVLHCCESLWMICVSPNTLNLFLDVLWLFCISLRTFCFSVEIFLCILGFFSITDDTSLCRCLVSFCLYFVCFCGCLVSFCFVEYFLLKTCPPSTICVPGPVAGRNQSSIHPSDTV